MNDRLRFTRNIKQFILYIDDIVDDFPNNEKVLRDKIKDAAYFLLEFAFLANENDVYREVKQRIFNQRKIIVYLKMLDFYFYQAYLNKFVEYKRYTKISKRLLSLVKELYGWMRSDEYRRGIYKKDLNYKKNISKLKDEESNLSGELLGEKSK